MSNTITEAMIHNMSQELDKFAKMSAGKIAKELNVTLTSATKVRKLFEAKGLLPKYQRTTLTDMVEAVIAGADIEEAENVAEGVQVAETA